MNTLQIIILILGALIFTVSFFIPDKKVNTKEIRDKEEKIFRELVEKEIPDIRKKFDEATEESIERAKENTQRQMERLTNEKMMAINEYSDTVMSEIHKNHEEAVFLYDMLNNKHVQVKNATAELNQVLKESKQTQAAVKSTKSKGYKKNSKANARSYENTRENAILDNDALLEKQTNEKVIDFEPMASADLEVIIPPMDMMPVVDEVKKDSVNTDNVEIRFSPEGSEENSNARILEMYRAGKSNTAIAKELGLGIGEVKLVINLFKDGM